MLPEPKAENEGTIIKDKSNYFSFQQVERMLRNAPSYEVWLLILLLWRTGRRVSEVLQIRPRDIDFDNHLIYWKILKKRKPRREWKAQDYTTIRELRKYIQRNEIKDHEWIFTSPRLGGGKYKRKRIIHRTRKWAFEQVRDVAVMSKILFKKNKKVATVVKDDGFTTYHLIPGWHPHHFRHSFAINFLKKSDTAMALPMLKDQLAHSNMAITQHYLEFSQEDRVKMLNKIFKKKSE